MKKLFISLLCLCLVFSASGCGKKDTGQDNASISDIPAATATDEPIDESSADESDDVQGERTPESDRREIENNLRDAQQLIDDGNYDDATMIINSLKTRDLTKEESEKLKDLQKQMIKVSD